MKKTVPLLESGAIFTLIRPRKINVLFQVRKFSKLDARTRKNYKDPKNYKVFFSIQNADFQYIYGDSEYSLGIK